MNFIILSLILLFLSIIVFEDFYNDLGEKLIHINSSLINALFIRLKLREHDNESNNVIFLAEYRKNKSDYKKQYSNII